VRAYLSKQSSHLEIKTLNHQESMHSRQLSKHADVIYQLLEHFTLGYSILSAVANGILPHDMLLNAY